MGGGDPYMVARERFRADTEQHEMRVLHDEGLYRHLRFQAPRTYIYGFDIITWPGHLAIAGDVQDHTFSRIPDMFDFFGGSDTISPDYWAEKITSRPDRAATRVFTVDAYRRTVEEWLKEAVEEIGEGVDEGDPGDPGLRVVADLRLAVREQLLDVEEPCDRRAAIERLEGFEHDRLTIRDAYEYDMREWDNHYLWCCWAIVWGIAEYRKVKP